MEVTECGVDFRTLNKIVKPISFPLPLIDDILSLLGDSKYFTALDLKSGYWQVKLEEDSKEKTAFACHRGLFQFNMMPFELNNAPAVFQELMIIVLQGCEEFAMAYFDDVLIFSKDPEVAGSNQLSPVGISLYRGRPTIRMTGADESNRVYWFKTIFLSLVYL